jgi:cytochrome c
MRRAIAVVLLTGIVLSGWGAPSPAAGAQDQPSANDRTEFGGLPAGPGREAVYYTCRACHSLNQFTQQRMDRDDWQAVIGRMIESNNMAEPEPWAKTLILSYLSTHYGVDEEDWAGLPPGEGREDIFYTCQACHSLKTVLQQRLSRDVWDETLVWMIEEQGMPQPDPDEYARLLEYLGTYLAPN